MTIVIKHPFTSAKADGADATLVQATGWNAAHTITMAANTLMGRSGTDGAAQEIPCTTFMQALLASTSLTNFLLILGIGVLTTGDFKSTLKTTADPSWIMCDDGTIGDTTSGATSLADPTAQALYTLIWTVVSDTYAPVTGGRGGSAAADWAAHKPIALTKVLGRVLAASGAGAGLTVRSLGQTVGEENHALTGIENGPHIHGITDPQHAHGPGNGSNFYTDKAPTNFDLANSGASYNVSKSPLTALASTGITINTSGSGSGHNNMQPTSFVNFMVKL
jgi:microcystin-dependent protein